VNDKTHDADIKLSARRRLVRGVFAAPAALTLYSGSVAARSIRNCVTKQVERSDLTPIPTAIQGTTYVRVQLQMFQRNGGNSAGNWSRWVRGFDVSALQAPGGTVFVSGTSATSTSWYLYDRGPQSNYFSVLPGSAAGTIGSTPSENTASPNRTTTQSAVEWVALRINSAGDIVGVVGINNINTTSAVYQTCWSSFRLG
jgi:hypothetical protein